MTTFSSFTKAYCCAPGEDVWPDGSRPNSINHPICIGTLHSQDHVTYTAVRVGEEEPFTAGLLIQPAWVISWDETDRATLTPTPPGLPVGGYVDHWVPGGPEPTGDLCQDATCRDPSQGGHALQRQMMILITVPPIVFFCVVAGCGLCCFFENQKKARRRAAREQQALREQQAQARL
ncbi:hypothetical protein CGMCC3_g9922 [Colletotrichum fructicola]|nr:uncharacterized protein CGMCC3_g9922 [Colletotrichum fructicola]KAE9574061.1 hypothetical protein CGMCC3_g9922 [Colletotrichum fructicola]KAF4430580.1 hypothetical protein CFRS1_v009546 [Colletotrichum fructicola]KAF4481841.1 hypothetical protein CGGC5_v009027 [Colletotrichum fructicola Nara gc5]